MNNKICVGDCIKWQESADGLAVVVRKQKNKEGGITCWIYHKGGEVSEWPVEDLELHSKFLTMRYEFLDRMEWLRQYCYEQNGGN
jgi:hypothetical protein